MSAARLYSDTVAWRDTSGRMSNGEDRGGAENLVERFSRRADRSGCPSAAA